MPGPDLAIQSASFEMWGAFAIIIGGIVILARDRLPIEISSLAIVAALLLFFTFFPVTSNPVTGDPVTSNPVTGDTVTGDTVAVPGAKNLLSPTRLLAGFANPVLFTILALLVMGQGLFQTGAIEYPTKVISRLGNKKPALAFALALFVAGLTSAFLNNTPVVVIFIPIMSAMALSIGLNLGRALMPLSFICILGGMTTLIGSSSNLIVAAIALDGGFGPIKFFDFTKPALLLAGIGALYVIFILPRIVHTPARDSEQESRIRGRQFVTDIPLYPGHPWIGAKSRAGFFSEIKDMTVRMVHRDGKIFSRPIENLTLSEGDIVSVAITRRRLTSALTDPEGIYQPTPTSTNEETPAGEASQPVPGREHVAMVEAVVAPSSSMLGLKLGQAARRLDTGVTLVGIERRRRMLRKPMGDILLEAGDVLLLLGKREAVRSVRQRSDLYFSDWSLEELPTAHHAYRAILIFVTTIFAAATGLVPIVVATITGALALVLTGCLNLRQVSRAIDQKIYLLIGTAFAMSEALRVTGGAELLAESMVSLVSGHGPAVLLSALFLMTAFLTNVLSNQATAALMTPITLSASAQIGVDPTPFIYGLIFALNCSFATPIAYQTNLIVMGPGNYTFSDFIKGGLPLVLLIWITWSFFAPWYYGL